MDTSKTTIEMYTSGEAMETGGGDAQRCEERSSKVGHGSQRMTDLQKVWIEIAKGRAWIAENE